LRLSRAGGGAQREIRELLLRSETLNSPSTFAQSAKLVRQARAKETHLKAVKQRAALDSRRMGYVVLAFRSLLYLLALAAMWGRAAVTLPRGLSAWPLSFLLSLPDCRGEGWPAAAAGEGGDGTGGEHGHGHGHGHEHEHGHGHGHAQAPLQVISAGMWLFLCDRACARLLRAMPPGLLIAGPAKAKAA